MQVSLTSLAKVPTWQDWVYFAVRWLLIIGMGLVVFAMRQTDGLPIDDIIIAVVICSVANIALAFSAGLKPLYAVSEYIAILTDWIIVGVFVRIIGNEPQPVLGAVSAVIVLGFMRQGAAKGFIEAIGVFVAAVIALLSLTSADPFEWIGQAFSIYLVPTLFVILLALTASAWLNIVQSQRKRREADERDLVEQQGKALSDMRERTHALSDMAMELNSTLNYERILDAALKIGRLSMRSDNRHRVISLVLLYIYDNNLQIVNSQGLSHVDNYRIFPGRAGIIASSLRETRPMFGTTAKDDPELRTLVSFQNVRSLLCVPLRAGFDNYGVLLYGSESKNAFNTDQVDTLKIIGTQATIALQNAVLYQNLMDEKERIIQLEEDARKDLVRDLHDVPTQTIAAVAMRLGIIPKMMERDTVDKVLAEIETIRNMTLRATEEIRHVLFKLRPLVLESRGLSAGLDQLAIKMQETYEQPMKVAVDKQVEGLLDVSQQGAIFYLVEEAVNNARKYAEASLIRVSVNRQEDTIVVKIMDNGKGFDKSTVDDNYDERGSFGMVNMRERAELLDGILDVKSIPGKGTQIIAYIPIPSGKSDSRAESDDTQSRIPKTKLSLAALEKTSEYTPY